MLPATRGRVLDIVCPLVTLVVLLGAWQLYISVFTVPDYILPSPKAVGIAFAKAYGGGLIWPHLSFTLRAMLAGYVLGCTAGIVLGSLLAESRTFERFLYPYIVLLQSMPKVALAPLLIVWFGFDIESKIVMVALICFFPVFVNTLVGIRQADADLVDVLRAFSASRMHIFLQVKVPAAASSIFGGLQIAVVLGLIGAIVAEFVASRQGLGTFIQSAAQQLDTALMFTGVITLAFLGLAGNLIIRAIHRRVVFWESQNSSRAVAADSEAA